MDTKDILAIISLVLMVLFYNADKRRKKGDYVENDFDKILVGIAAIVVLTPIAFGGLVIIGSVLPIILGFLWLYFLDKKNTSLSVITFFLFVLTALKWWG